ncbi:MAG: DUF1007 family protein [Candidatus Thiodiazotropha sp. (ex Ctena orbiculata)]|uniref:DUF1007 family protein n=1 Tax=Candidatus Thiodiazotropha taylori TaxID=2792791 RepID=A0A944MC75_9GAMM|nr:DUF1007 family protein [Candidatus Thiodiazotropha taylori]MBT2989228.1 DUF1007 family protein [Candidatus Thiodiazotropha taylori]MBT2995561.1 DUF1007 family protein [Candidatus Thiodiazotropha taylori]MBT2999485.1 DUF1007 family protein [Candidatus Thiodiazotropha taylori]MBT3025717.1 DUF1007 family protein [Candidatus Thiodiazotropha taylori]
MAVLTIAMCFAPGTQAHPHHWIDVFTEWQFNPKGLISGVKLRWLFDDYYSVLLLDDTTATGKDLQVVLEKTLRNIGRHRYFLQIEQQGVKAEFGDAKHARIGVWDHRIEIEFSLALKAPFDPRQSDIVFRIAEPTYYFEMLHAEESPAIVLRDAPPACRYRLEPPKPDAALVAYAASLGINESGGDGLGIQFAETVTIRCE